MCGGGGGQNVVDDVMRLMRVLLRGFDTSTTASTEKQFRLNIQMAHSKGHYYFTLQHNFGLWISEYRGLNRALCLGLE